MYFLRILRKISDCAVVFFFKFQIQLLNSEEYCLNNAFKLSLKAVSQRHRFADDKPKTKRFRSNIELTNLIQLASIYGNVDYINCKGHKITFLRKREITFATLSRLRAFNFCLVPFTFNVKTSFTENVYLHNLHRAALTQKRKCKSSLFKPGKNYVDIKFIVTETIRMF